MLGHIDAVLAAPDARRALDARLEAFAEENDITLGPTDREGMAELAEGYVRAVADLLLACDAAATAAGVQAFTAPVVLTAAEYFLRPQDWIPDPNGLYGLLDDAYLACRFVARMSQLVAAERGVPLVDTTLDAHSATIRVLIGEPLAARLDAEVEATLGAVLGQLQLSRMQPLSAPGAWSQWAHRENVINTEAQILAIASGGY